MTHDEADIRDRLYSLATGAPLGPGVAGAERVMEIDRLQRRRRGVWSATALAIAVVVVGATTVLRAVQADAGPEANNQVAAPGSIETAGVLGLYGLAPRGSLAADQGLLEQALAASWDDGTGDDTDQLIDPAADTRRVSFIGEVPGGQAWALVQGVVEGQTYFIWFADIDRADGVTWQRSWGPDRSFPDIPIALLDTAGDSGPLVVVTTPGDTVEYSSTGTGDNVAAPGYQPLETVDGVAVAEVASPQYPRFSTGFQVVRDDVIAYEQPPRAFDSTEPLGPQPAYQRPADAPPSEEYGQRMADCLRPLGFEVTIEAGGEGIGFQTTRENEQAYDEAVDTCQLQTGYE